MNKPLSDSKLEAVTGGSYDFSPEVGNWYGSLWSDMTEVYYCKAALGDGLFLFNMYVLEPEPDGIIWGGPYETVCGPVNGRRCRKPAGLNV